MSKHDIIKIDSITTTPLAAIDKLSTRLPELYKKTEAFNRTNSQTTLNLMTLTMMTGQSPMRQVRQILAEVERRQVALAESQVTYAKLIEEEIDSSLSPTIYDAETRLKNFKISQLENKISGSIKDIATLISAYDRLVEKHNISEWTEEDFEKEEAAHHIRRGFELLYRNIIECGRPKEATIEYMQQFGVHIQIATQEVIGYISVVEEMIKTGDRPNSSHIEDFLDEMCKKYQHCSQEVSSRMFGVDNLIIPEYMNIGGK